MSFSPGDVLLVPVAFSDGSGSKKRPVVIIYNSGDSDLLVAPVTSQAARSLRDITLENWKEAGLRLPSIARLENLATVEKSTVIKTMGKLTPNDRKSIHAVLDQFFTEILSRQS